MFQFSLLSPLKRNCRNYHHKLTGIDRAANKGTLLNYWAPASKKPVLKRMWTRKVTVWPAVRKTRFFPWMFTWCLSKPVRTCPLWGSPLCLVSLRSWGLGGESDLQRMQLGLARIGQPSLCQVSQKGAAPFILSLRVSLGDLHFTPAQESGVVLVTNISKCQILKILRYLRRQISQS